jgi:predicted DNA-binding protein (MmcQ/YjbR family)
MTDRASDPQSGSHHALVESTLRIVRRISSELPDLIETQVNQHSRFEVRGRTAAYFLVDHHGDGILGLVVKVALGENHQFVQRDSKRFYLPDYLASKGWLGIRLDIDQVPWDVVRDLVWESYRLVAPTSLVRRMPHS